MVYLEITLDIAAEDRARAAAVYQHYKAPFLETVAGASEKTLLVRDQDVQVLHGFAREDQARAYLESPLFNQDVVTALKPMLRAAPDVRIYTAA